MTLKTTCGCECVIQTQTRERLAPLPAHLVVRDGRQQILVHEAAHDTIVAAVFVAGVLPRVGHIILWLVALLGAIASIVRVSRSTHNFCSTRGCRVFKLRSLCGKKEPSAIGKERRAD